MSPDPSNYARTDQNSRHAPKTTRNERLYGIRCAFGSSGRWRLYRLCFVCTLTKAKVNKRQQYFLLSGTDHR